MRDFFDFMAQTVNPLDPAQRLERLAVDAERLAGEIARLSDAVAEFGDEVIRVTGHHTGDDK
jgi:hypothetical protein